VQVALALREWLEAVGLPGVYQTAMGLADHESMVPKHHVRKYIVYLGTED
jgi:hypothetical protein